MNKQQMKKTQFVRLINFVSSCIRKYLRIVISPVAIGQLSVNWTWLMAYISWNYRTQSLSSSKMILHISCQFYRFKLIKFRRKYSYTMDWCGRGIISNILLIIPSQQSKQMLRGKKTLILAITLHVVQWTETTWNFSDSFICVRSTFAKIRMYLGDWLTLCISIRPENVIV